MLPIEDIHKKLSQLGYITIEKAILNPCYYELNNGDILEILSTLQGILIDSNDIRKFSANLRTHFHIYTNENDRAYNMPAQPTNLAEQTKKLSTIIDEDVEFTILKDDFSRYELSNNLQLSIKPSIIQIRKLDSTSMNGESIYNIQNQPIIKQVMKKLPK